MGAGASALAAGNPVPAAQNNQPIRLAIIGTGHRGWAHLAILKALPEYQVVALADPTPENLDRAATLAPGAKTYSDYRRMLAERKDLDAVVVITPSFLHAEPTVAAFDHGLPAAAGEIGKIVFASGNLFRGDWNPRSWTAATTHPPGDEVGIGIDSIGWRTDYLCLLSGFANRVNLFPIRIPTRRRQPASGCRARGLLSSQFRECRQRSARARRPGASVSHAARRGDGRVMRFFRA